MAGGFQRAGRRARQERVRIAPHRHGDHARTGGTGGTRLRAASADHRHRVAARSAADAERAGDRRNGRRGQKNCELGILSSYSSVFGAGAAREALPLSAAGTIRSRSACPKRDFSPVETVEPVSRQVSTRPAPSLSAAGTRTLSKSMRPSTTDRAPETTDNAISSCSAKPTYWTAFGLR